MSIRFYKSCKNSALLSSILLIVACHPPSPANDEPSNADNVQVDSPIVADSESITMASDYILSIKPSRYQPSLGLQGVIEPIKQSRFVTAQDVVVQEVLVAEGEWVDKGMPLLIVSHRRNTGGEKQTVNSEAGTTEPSDEVQKDNQLNGDTDKADNSQDEVASAPSSQQVVVRASFAGRVMNVSVKNGQQVEARMPLIYFSDDRDLSFISTLPIETKPKLSVGQAVNFTAKGLSGEFAGQVSKLVAGDQPDKLLVHVHVVNNEASRGTLKPDMVVTGRVDYGQIEVGTIVPEQGIHNVDLSVLKRPPYQSLMPLNATVWIIKQDQRLTQHPVEVIKYDPSTEQYLIAGVSNDSLICLADLPKTFAGKKVNIS